MSATAANARKVLWVGGNQLLLQLNGPSASLAPGGAGSNVGSLYNQSGDLRLLAAGGVPGIAVQSTTGYVGVGLTNPQYQLDVSGGIHASGTLWGSNATFTGTLSASNLTVMGSLLSFNTPSTFTCNVSIVNVSPGPALVISGNGSNPLVLMMAGSNVGLYMSSNGAIGMGTSNLVPGYALDISGALLATIANFAQLYASNAIISGILAAQSNVYVTNAGPGPAFLVSQVENGPAGLQPVALMMAGCNVGLYVSGTGAMGVGTSNLVPGYALDISGALLASMANIAQMYASNMYVTNAGPGPAFLISQVENGPAGQQPVALMMAGCNVGLYVSGTGAVGVGTSNLVPGYALDISGALLASQLTASNVSAGPALLVTQVENGPAGQQPVALLMAGCNVGLYVSGTGAVGVGTSNLVPGYALDISGALLASSATVGSLAANSNVVINNPGAGPALLVTQAEGGAAGQQPVALFMAGSSVGLYVSSNGGVGIGQSSVTSGYALDVSGVVRATSFVGSVAGLIGSTQWISALNCNVVMPVGSNVGIGGTMSPLCALDVSGDINFSGALWWRGVPYVGSQWTTSTSNVVMPAGSNVGIGGTLAPAYTLDVTGTERVTGSIIATSFMDANSNNLFPSWMTFPGVLFSNTANETLALGSGPSATLSSSYLVQGANIVTVRIWMTLGAGATLGGGSAWTWTLPLPPADTPGTVVGSAVMRSATGGASYTGTACLGPSGTVVVALDGVDTGASPSEPFAWASGDSLSLNLNYALTPSHPVTYTTNNSGPALVVVQNAPVQPVATFFAEAYPAMIIDQAGNVAIGQYSVTPGYALDVNGAIKAKSVTATTLNASNINVLGDGWLNTIITNTTSYSSNVAIVSQTTGPALYVNQIQDSLGGVQPVALFMAGCNPGLYISSSGSVGIGKSSVGAGLALDVSGVVRASLFVGPGSSQWTTSNGNVYMPAGSNVGIGGTAAPAYALDVSGSARISSALAVGMTTTTALPGVALDVSGVINFSQALWFGGKPYIGSQWTTNNTNITIGSGSNVGIGGTTPPVCALDVSGSGRVTLSLAVGKVTVASPNVALDVSGSVNFSGTLLQNGMPYIGSQWTTVPATGSVYMFNGSNVGIGGTAAPVCPLDVSGAVRVTGAVAVGRTSAGAGLALDVAGVGAFSAGMAVGRLTAAYPLDVSGGFRASGVSTFSSNVGVGTTNPQYTVEVNGAMGVTGDVSVLYSDDRLKTRVAAIEGALDKVMRLHAFTYRNNELAQSLGFADDRVRVGLSAQEVASVLPEAVLPAPFDRLLVDGVESSRTGQNYTTVQYEKLVPLLVAAIQELYEKTKPKPNG